MNVKQLLMAKTGSLSGSYHNNFSKSEVNGQSFLTSTSAAKPAVAEADVVARTALQGEAELLLSFANIARCEITDHPSALDESSHHHLPMLPNLLESSSSEESEATSMMVVSPVLLPRSELIPLPHFKPLPAPSRLRTVSFDTAHYVLPLGDCGRSRTPSPIDDEEAKTPIVSPEIRRPMVRSTRQSRRACRKAAKKTSSYHHDEAMGEMEESSSFTDDDDEVEHHHHTITTKVIPNKKLRLSVTSVGGRSFQTKPPSGVAITTIHRRKFSWKNYPEVCLLFDKKCRAGC
jgi:hypothetical protein